MRMRTKPWANDFLESNPYALVNSPEDYKGQWRTVLPYERINVEIGCGKGDYWLTMAQMHPDQGWIAIEKERNCAAVALKKSLELSLDNIRFILNDAQDIDLWFEEGELDALYLNFSDPWPKNRNTKRRLTYNSFLKKYESVLKKEGILTLKTDNTKLFEFSLVSFSQDWLLNEVSLDFDSEANNDALTEYERRFKEEGIPIKRAVFLKR